MGHDCFGALTGWFPWGASAECYAVAWGIESRGFLMTGHFAFPHCPPGAADIMQELHITELYLCFLGSLPSSRDCIGTVRAGTINQFASRPLGMKEPGGHWKVGMGPMNILRLKRTEGPLWFGLPGPTAFPPFTRAFQERSGLSLCGIGVSSRGLTEGQLISTGRRNPPSTGFRSSAYFYFKFHSLTVLSFGPRCIHMP